ncbi:hypothetical protein U1Q18_017853 [Sarracenia purpurea var. burkii]
MKLLRLREKMKMMENQGFLLRLMRGLLLSQGEGDRDKPEEEELEPRSDDDVSIFDEDLGGDQRTTESVLHSSEVPNVIPYIFHPKDVKIGGLNLCLDGDRENHSGVSDVEIGLTHNVFVERP